MRKARFAPVGKEECMESWDILLIGVALAMDAVAVGMTDGMAEPRMKPRKMFAIAAAFAFFQFIMPVLGYYCGYAFARQIGGIAPYLSFAVLAFLGGKMIFESFSEEKEGVPARRTGAWKVLAQAVATSIDALAVGVTLLAAESEGGLPAHVALCSLVIGLVTLCLALPAVCFGRYASKKLGGRAELFGGAVLVLIGIKLLLEGIL